MVLISFLKKLERARMHRGLMQIECLIFLYLTKMIWRPMSKQYPCLVNIKTKNNKENQIHIVINYMRSQLAQELIHILLNVNSFVKALHNKMH